MMDWTTLLSTHRYGAQEAARVPSDRSAYMRDHDRIIFSSAFRRLQDKTQVYSTGRGDFVRTRLTHSLEVSCVGRSLGIAVGSHLLQPAMCDVVPPQDVGWIVSAASLAHDIGNPPFGHEGEDAIRSWFSDDGSEYLEGLTAEEADDFLGFEGNAQSFRILTRLQSSVDKGGLQLTAAVLGALIKYPYSASEGRATHRKKSGYLQSDARAFASVVDHLGLGLKADGTRSRHPLVFLVEVADDICYGVADIEDGYRVGLVSFEEAEALLGSLAPSRLEGSRYKRLVGEEEKIGHLRAWAISELVNDAVATFQRLFMPICTGAYDNSLMSQGGYAEPMAKISDFSKKRLYGSQIFNPDGPGVRAVVHGLLGYFSRSIDIDSHSPLARVSARYSRVRTRYEKLLCLTDHISGMTDRYALGTFRDLGLPAS